MSWGNRPHSLLPGLYLVDTVPWSPPSLFFVFFFNFFSHRPVFFFFFCIFFLPSHRPGFFFLYFFFQSPASLFFSIFFSHRPGFVLLFFQSPSRLLLTTFVLSHCSICLALEQVLDLFVGSVNSISCHNIFQVLSGFQDIQYDCLAWTSCVCLKGFL